MNNKIQPTRFGQIPYTSKQEDKRKDKGKDKRKNTPGHPGTGATVPAEPQTHVLDRKIIENPLSLTLLGEKQAGAPGDKRYGPGRAS